MKFVTRMPAEGHQDGLDGKRVMTGADLRKWIARGLPALNRRQLAALGRSWSYWAGDPPEEGAMLAKTIHDAFLLSQPPASPPSPSRVPSNPTSSRPTKAGRTAGNGKLSKKARKALKKAKRLKLAIAGGEAITTGDVPFLMAGADPELQALWREQMASDRVVTLSDPAPSRGTAPMGMDDDRYRLHQEAKQLAEDKMKVDPRLDPGETYALAAIEIEDRKSGAIWLAS